MFSQHSYLFNKQTDNFSGFAMKNFKNIDLVTSRLMLAMGFKLSLLGTTYLREAIVYRYDYSLDCKISLSKQILSHIAQKYNVSINSIDRDMRTALIKCYNDGTMFALNDILGCGVISKQYAPTISEFIMIFVTYFKTMEAEFSA